MIVMRTSHAMNMMTSMLRYAYSMFNPVMLCNAVKGNLKDLMHAMYYVHGALPRYATDGTDAYI